MTLISVPLLPHPSPLFLASSFVIELRFLLYKITVYFVSNTNFSCKITAKNECIFNRIQFVLLSTILCLTRFVLTNITPLIWFTKVFISTLSLFVAYFCTWISCQLTITSIYLLLHTCIIFSLWCTSPLPFSVSSKLHSITLNWAMGIWSPPWEMAVVNYLNYAGKPF